MENNKIKINIDIMFFIIFLVLKLDGIIQWKWFWVFSPFWIVWIAQISIMVITAITNIKRKPKHDLSYGKPLVWDAKTNTMYGPFEEE